MASINGWDEKTTVLSMQNKLGGLAKQWFSTLNNLDLKWKDWKTTIINAFPDAIDYNHLLSQMMARKKLSNETMMKYFYEKSIMLRKLEIKGKNAVSCIIGGLVNENQKAGAKAGNYNTPESLFTEFLSNLNDEVVPTTKTTAQFNDKATRKTTSEKTKIKCYNCKALGHYASDCRQPKKFCPRCKKLGHEEQECRNKKNERCENVKIVRHDDNKNNETFVQNVEVNGQKMTANIDTGSSVNLISRSAALKSGRERIQEVVALKGFCGGNYMSIEKIRAKIGTANSNSEADLHIVKMTTSTLTFCWANHF